MARKSDHICVVRDVPDTRSSWYQRQQQQQHSLDQAQMQPVPAGAPQSAAAPPSAAKSSLAALLGKHPAIKEEPTTPGGSLVQASPDTPPPSFGRARSPAVRQQATGDQITQLMSMISELKTDIRQDLGQLGRRVDSLEASVSRVSQSVSLLDKHCQAAGSSAPLDPRRLSSSSAAGTAASQMSSRRGSSTLAPPGQEAPSTSPDQPTGLGARERSKSPHKHHHHHHHHHRKHSTAVPSSGPGPDGPESRQLLQPLSVAEQRDPASSKARPASRDPSEDDEDQDATSKL